MGIGLLDAGYYYDIWMQACSDTQYAVGYGLPMT